MSASVNTTGAKRKRGPQRGSHHIDRRADQILAADQTLTATGDDDLLKTREVSGWLGVSESWLEAGRAKGFGPPWFKLGTKGVRYRRGSVKAWLDQRGMRLVSGREVE